MAVDAGVGFLQELSLELVLKPRGEGLKDRAKERTALFSC